MANNSVKPSGLAACSTPQGTDLMILSSNVAGNITSMSVTVNTFLTNTAANVTSNVITAATLAITGNSTPANATDNGGRANGSVWADGSFIYYWDGTAITKATLESF